MITASIDEKLTDQGLSGADVLVTFNDVFEVAHGVGALLACNHGHNFAVLMDRPYGKQPGIMTTKNGFACLERYYTDHPTVDTSFTVAPPRIPSEMAEPPPF